MTWLINFVHPFKVRVTSTSGGNHVPNSWHYQHRAIDVVGTEAELERLMRAAVMRADFFREAFYDPFGRFVKNGRVHLGKVGGHADHLHLAR